VLHTLFNRLIEYCKLETNELFYIRLAYLHNVAILDEDTLHSFEKVTSKKKKRLFYGIEA